MLTSIQKDLVIRTSHFVQKELFDIESGHDWWHSWRVSQIASYLAQIENGNELICILSALLHDVTDPKFKTKSTESGDSSIKKYLSSLKIRKSAIKTILYIIENISYGNEISGIVTKTIEFSIVQDADRLDAIGAIGIARAFNYGGHKNRRIHIPGVLPAIYQNTKEYRQSKSATIMHFYEKLLLLKDMMNTKTAKLIAQQRHDYMSDFLDRFLLEWNEFALLNKNKNPGNPGF
jgi:uncharacterized protein